jgi:hypothetical protein
MRTLCAVAVFALVAILTGSLAGQEKKDPKKYDSKDGKFSAVFPNGAEIQTKTAGGLTLKLFLADYEKGKGGYLVTYSDLDPALLKAPKPEQVLESSEKGLVEKFRGVKVTKSAATTFGTKKYPAREIVAEREEWNMRATLVLVGNRLYQVCVFGPKEMTTAKAADDFLASFQLAE